MLFILWGCGTTHYVYKQSSIIPYPYPAPHITSETIHTYVKSINAIRREGRRCGNLGYFPAVAPLRWNKALYLAAYEHSADMLAANVFTHKGSHSRTDWTTNVQHLGRASTFTDRIENNGYLQWKRLGQNIATGMPTVEKTMEQWVTSEHHCENMMNPEFEEFGMAHVSNSSTRFNHYWTQNFATHQ